MKIGIYDSGSSAPAIKPVILRLVPRNDGVTVALVDESGKEVTASSLVTFKNDGTVYLHLAINEEYGLQLDTSGQQVVAQHRF